MLACGIRERRVLLQPCDITDRFEAVYGVLEKAQDVGRVHFDPEFVLQIGRDLTVIESVLPELDDKGGKFAFRTATDRTGPAFAGEKGLNKCEELPVNDGIETVEVEAGADGLKSDCMEG